MTEGFELLHHWLLALAQFEGNFIEGRLDAFCIAQQFETGFRFFELVLAEAGFLQFIEEEFIVIEFFGELVLLLQQFFQFLFGMMPLLKDGFVLLQ